jgi:hypothetical protein
MSEAQRRFEPKAQRRSAAEIEEAKNEFASSFCFEWEIGHALPFIGGN